MLDAVRGYLQMATGLTEITLRRALEVAESLLGPDDDEDAGDGRAASEQVQDLAADIVSGATADKQALVGLIRSEIDKAAGRLGFVREEELAAVRRHLVRLEGQVVEVRAELAALGTPEGPSRPTLAKPRSRSAPDLSSGTAARHDPAAAAEAAAPGSPSTAKPVKRKVPAGTRAGATQPHGAGTAQDPT